MSEKLVPPTKKVPRADGIKQGSADTVLTTPNDNESKVWSKKDENGKIF